MFDKERRKHPRIETEVTVEIYSSPLQTEDPDLEEICLVLNLSETGMRFRARHRFSNSQLLRLTFLLPESIIIIRTDAEIIHLQRKNDGYNEIGVQFTKISLAERKLIRHFISKKLSCAFFPVSNIR